jgi:hypothetical protein
MHKAAMTVIAALTLLLAAVQAPAVEPGRGPLEPHGDFEAMSWPGMERSCRTPEDYLELRDYLGLSPVQVNKLNGMHTALKKERILKGARVKALEIELDDIMAKVDFKPAEALEKLREIEKARTELRAAVIKAASDARDALGPEQVERLTELVMSTPVTRRRGPGPGPMPAGKPAPDGPEREMMKEMMMKRMMEQKTPDK